MTYFKKDENGEFVEVTGRIYSEDEYLKIKSKNDEFRESNTKLLKTNESLSAFAKVLDGVQNVTPEALHQKIEDLATERAEKMLTETRSKYETELSEKNKAYLDTSSRLSKLMLGQAVQSAGAKHGVISSAYDDVLRRAEDAFTIKDGAMVPKDELTRDANGNPITIDYWMEQQAKNAPHLFAKSSGPVVSRPANVRVHQSAGENRSATDLIASGLAARDSNGAKRL